MEDLPETEGVTLLDEPDRPLVTVLAPRLIEEEVVGEAELEFDAEGEPIVVDADAAGEEGEAS